MTLAYMKITISQFYFIARDRLSFDYISRFTRITTLQCEMTLFFPPGKEIPIDRLKSLRCKIDFIGDVYRISAFSLIPKTYTIMGYLERDFGFLICEL